MILLRFAVLCIFGVAFWYAIAGWGAIAFLGLVSAVIAGVVIAWDILSSDESWS